MHNAAVGAYWHIYALFKKVFIARAGNFLHGCRLAAANALGFPCYAYRSAAYTYLYKVRAGIGQEAEALAVNHVACANLYAFAIFSPYKVQRSRLPFAEAFGRIYAEYVRARFDQRGYALLIIARVYARANNIALLLIKQLCRVFLMRIVVLSEHECNHVAFLCYNRQGVELMLPNYVVCFFERYAFVCKNKSVYRRHELTHFRCRIHTAGAIIAAGNNAEQFAGCRTIVRYGNGGMTRALLKGKYVRHGLIGPDRRIAHGKTRLILFDPAYHRRLAFYGL